MSSPPRARSAAPVRAPGRSRSRELQALEPGGPHRRRLPDRRAAPGPRRRRVPNGVRRGASCGRAWIAHGRRARRGDLGRQEGDEERIRSGVRRSSRPPGRATTDFVKRLFTGELRQGALAGVMTDAVAKAAGVPLEVTRRALMLSGDLTRTAEIAMTAGEEGLLEVGFELFRPILPMLASTAESVGDAVAGYERALVEWKLDGIRIDPPPRRRSAHLHAEPERDHGRAARHRRGGAAPSGQAGRARRRGALDGRRRPRSRRRSRESIETRHPRSRDLPLRSPARRRRGSAGHPARAASRPARGAGAGSEDPWAPHVRSGRGKPCARRGPQRRTRRRRREGRGVPACGRPPWEIVEEGEACSDLRPRGARRRVGTRATTRLAPRTCTSVPAIRRPADS